MVRVACLLVSCSGRRGTIGRSRQSGPGVVVGVLDCLVLVITHRALPVAVQAGAAVHQVTDAETLPVMFAAKVGREDGGPALLRYAAFAAASSGATDPRRVA